MTIWQVRSPLLLPARAGLAAILASACRCNDVLPLHARRHALQLWLAPQCQFLLTGRAAGGAKGGRPAWRPLSPPPKVRRPAKRRLGLTARQPASAGARPLEPRGRCGEVRQHEGMNAYRAAAAAVMRPMRAAAAAAVPHPRSAWPGIGGMRWAPDRRAAIQGTTSPPCVLRAAGGGRRRQGSGGPHPAPPACVP